MKKNKWIALEGDMIKATSLNILTMQDTREEVIKWLHERNKKAFVCKTSFLKKLKSDLFYNLKL